uniref:Uncharacterized protein n=1 Tax=Moniliophthora roreri TaxID=221103 RepID=A0A0W0FDU4_MONRR
MSQLQLFDVLARAPKRLH